MNSKDPRPPPIASVLVHVPARQTRPGRLLHIISLKTTLTDGPFYPRNESVLAKSHRADNGQNRDSNQSKITPPSVLLTPGCAEEPGWFPHGPPSDSALTPQGTAGRG